MQEEEKISIKETKELLLKIEAENKKTIELIERLEKLKAEDTISGKSEAGIEKPQETEEERIIKGARKLVEGTGLDPFS